MTERCNTKKELPLGVVPQEIFEESKTYERIEELIEALSRYHQADVIEEIPIDWVTELGTRLLALQKWKKQRSET